MKFKHFLAAAFLVIGGGNLWAETDYTSLMTGTWTGSGGDFQGGRERYQAANYAADTKVMYQSITAPADGIYEIKFYAVASSTSGRGFTNIWGDNIAVAYASAGSNNVTLPMSVINQVGCTLQEAGNIRTLSIEAKSGESIEYGLKNIAEGGNWYTIKGISVKMKTVAEIYQDTYDAAKAILDNSTETVDGAKATFATAVSAMQTALTGTLAEATAAAEALATAQATYCTKSFPTKGSGVKYDFTGRMNLAVNGWTCAQGNGPAAYGFTGATEAYKGSAYSAGKVMYQSISGLPLGEYEVHFYGVANSPRGESNSGDGIAQAYANTTTLDIEVGTQEGCTPSDYERVLTCDVKDGNLEFGLQNVAVGGNWYVAKAVALYMVDGPDLSDYYNNISDNLTAANTAKTKKMNADVLSDLNDAIAGAEGYNSVAVIGQLMTINDNLSNAINAASTSIAYYEGITAKYNVLDAAGKAAFDATEIGTKYQSGSLVNEDYAAAIVAATKAQTTPGSDMTGAIVNPRPESETMNANGWTINTTAGNKPFVYGQFFEHYSADSENTFDYYQVIEGMPNGAYTVSADMWAEQLFDGMTEGNINGTLGVYGSGATETTAFATVLGKNSKKTAEFFVIDGTLRIGVKSFAERATKWFHADNFQLTYEHALSPEEIAQAEAAVAEETYNEALTAAENVLETWENKVGGVFQHTTEAYYGVNTARRVAKDAYPSDKASWDAHTEALNNAVTAFNSSMVAPDPAKYYRLYLAVDGQSTGLNMNLLKAGSKAITVTATPAAVNFTAVTSGYHINTVYGENIARENGLTTLGSASSLTASRGDRMVPVLNADGTVTFNSSYSSISQPIGAANSDGGSVSINGAVQKWIVSEPVELTDASMAVNATAQYGTFCAPYDVLIPADVTAGTASIDANGYTINIANIENGVIPANTPVILYAEDGLAETTFKGIAVAGTPKDGVLTGVYTSTTAEEGWYVLQNNDNKVGFYEVQDVKPTVGANRAYLTVPAAEGRVRAFYFDNNANAIEAISALANNAIEAIYNANGVKVNALQKGINVVKMQNGKTQKVLVK